MLSSALHHFGCLPYKDIQSDSQHCQLHPLREWMKVTVPHAGTTTSPVSPAHVKHNSPIVADFPFLSLVQCVLGRRHTLLLHTSTYNYCSLCNTSSLWWPDLTVACLAEEFIFRKLFHFLFDEWRANLIKTAIMALTSVIMTSLSGSFLLTSREIIFIMPV